LLSHLRRRAFFPAQTENGASDLLDLEWLRLDLWLGHLCIGDIDSVHMDFSVPRADSHVDLALAYCLHFDVGYGIRKLMLDFDLFVLNHVAGRAHCVIHRVLVESRRHWVQV